MQEFCADIISTKCMSYIFDFFVEQPHFCLFFVCSTSFLFPYRTSFLQQLPLERKFTLLQFDIIHLCVACFFGTVKNLFARLPNISAFAVGKKVLNTTPFQYQNNTNLARGQTDLLHVFTAVCLCSM